uniref:Uncharacterized protein n=1 Tax=Panagrolaimus sp. PS1159 TaxID=55785 RepID=A0AC35EZI8_9BILA
MSEQPKKAKPVAKCPTVLISYTSKSNEFIAELIQGKIMQKLGVHISRGRFKLLPEECTYMVALRKALCYADCNPIEAYENGTEPISLLKLYTILLTAGYTVKPAKDSEIPPSSSSDVQDIKHDYDVWHFSIPWSRNDLSIPPPTYRLIVADFRYQNQIPPRHQLSKLSLSGDGTVVIACGAVGTYSFFSIHGIPVNFV